jgi:hypothetical protein
MDWAILVACLIGGLVGVSSGATTGSSFLALGLGLAGLILAARNARDIGGIWDWGFLLFGVYALGLVLLHMFGIVVQV